jgi:exosortase B
MSTPASTQPAPALTERILDWWPIGAGLALLYLPTLYMLLDGGPWSTEEQAHGPIILALSIWLLWRQWPRMMERSAGGRSHWLGWPMLVFGLLLYAVGRSQQVLMAEIGSSVWVLVAVLLLQRGPQAFRAQWFPFFFMLFMIPLPGALVDMLTMPMKMAVSYATEHILYMAGFPIARSGVMLQIGQYQLLVANACAGLQTLLTLEALGLFYLNVVQHTSTFRNIALACLIIPISFSANVVRVMVLTLITYYFGDAVGQGFLHGFAGMVLFTSALLMIVSVDSLLQWIARKRQSRLAAPLPLQAERT